MYRLITCVCFLIIWLNFNVSSLEQRRNEDLLPYHVGINEELSFKENLNVSEEVKFYLYTRKNPLNYEQILVDQLYYLRWTHFDPAKPIKITTHGWKSTYRSAYNILIKNAYLTQYDTNVIIVDWSKYSKLWYFPARDFVAEVGEVVATFIDKLCDSYGIDPDKIHIVGHSLGAHIAGVAGLKTKRKVGRITGLDPAGPDFSLDDEDRISVNSAKFVDIIHTDGRLAGFYHPLGHVDFYPNGGTAIQPGCDIDFLTLRSHRRAYWLFAESITTPKGFSAVKCNSWSDYTEQNCDYKERTFMGEHVSKKATGNYYLRTNYRSPFALETLREQTEPAFLH